MPSNGHVLVCGLGDSGMAAAQLLQSAGYAVTVADTNHNPGLEARASELEQEGARVRLGVETAPDGGFDFCVVSPGIPVSSPLLRSIADRGVRCISELEWGWSRFCGRTIAVTGSNGKSTAVKWLADSLCAAGARAAPAGNYGWPVSRAALEQPDLEWLALEVSSFQLETTDRFRAEAAILLNIHPNHLDRHGELEAYRRLKARLFARSEERDACVVPVELAEDMRRLSGGKGRWFTFGRSKDADYRFENGQVWRGVEPRADLRGTYFDNEVLGLAGAAVVAGLEAVGFSAECAVRAARTFEPLPHRMQVVGEIRGVRFVNDSKATNLSAMAAALRMSPPGVRLIAGGLVKENDFSFVKELLSQKVHGVYLIGKAAKEMFAAWEKTVPCAICGDLETAVDRAWADAKRGDTVLLSPACASYDQFANFAERGKAFGQKVAALGAANG